MSAVSLQEYAAAIKRSGLLTADEVKQEYDSFRASRNFDADNLGTNAQRFAQYLESSDRVTAWQNAALLKGKHRGLIFGKFKMLRLLGVGGMGRVFLAEDQMLRRQVALKILPRKSSQQESVLQRFHLEARALARLDHRNIVRVHDVDIRDNTHYIVMEYVQGIDLHKRVFHDGPLSLEDAADFTHQAAIGLAHAHANDLIHRDVKPANLLLDQEGVIKVLDLGLALLQSDDEGAITMDPEKAIGTADYISPEQALNSHNLDHRTDIYSLGCSLYFFLTGRAPFGVGTNAQRLMAHQVQTARPINDVRSDHELDPIAPELIQICARMMAKKAEDRFVDCYAVCEALTPLLPDAPPTDSIAGSNRELKTPRIQVDESLQDTQSMQAMDTNGGKPTAGRSSKLDAASITSIVVEEKTPSKSPRSRTSHSQSKKKKHSNQSSMWIATGVLCAAVAGLAIYAVMGRSGSAQGRPGTTPGIATTRAVDGSELSPDKCYVVGNNFKYHRPSCQHARGRDNLHEISETEQASAAYSPCSTCKP